MQDRSRGFTLIELLVVISIIALLIGILLPALSRAKIMSKELKCLSQLRQISIGQMTYALSYQDTYAPGYTGVPDVDMLDWPWYRALKTYMEADEFVWDCPVATPRHKDVSELEQIVPGFTKLRWTDVNYGLPVYALATNGDGNPNSYGGSMGLSFEEDMYYGIRSSQRDMTPCRTDKVKRPDLFAMAGDTNNIGKGTRRAVDVRRVGFHGCNFIECQNSAHGDVPPGLEMHPEDSATNQWAFADGHAAKMTYLEVLATEGRMFRRDSGLTFTNRGG